MQARALVLSPGIASVHRVYDALHPMPADGGPPDEQRHGRDEGVPFAVRGNPNGARIVEAPATQVAMVELKRSAEAAGEEFFCATQMGGCGQRVIVVAGARRKPHFRHPPDSACQLTRVAVARDIYSHRLIQTELVRWLHHLGYQSQAERWLDSRSRVDVWCSPKAAIEVQLSGETVGSMQDRTDRYSRSGEGTVTWLFGTGRHISSRDALLVSEGLAQIVRLRPEPGLPSSQVFGSPPGGRRIDIGLLTEALDADKPPETRWWPLSDCLFDPAEGLRTPGHAIAVERARTRSAENERLAQLRARIRAREAAAKKNRPRQDTRPGSELEQSEWPVYVPPERPVPPHPMGGRRPTAKPLVGSMWSPHPSDGFWWRTAWIDGHWADGLPLRLVNQGWGALYITMLMSRGRVEDLVGHKPGPDRLAVAQYLADLGLIEIDGPTAASSPFRTTNDLRYAGTEHEWHQPPAWRPDTTQPVSQPSDGPPATGPYSSSQLPRT